MFRIGAQAVNKAEVTLFGSYVSRFCKPDSDADFSLTYRNFCPWLVGIEKVDLQNAKRLARFAKMATEEGMLHSKFIQAKIPVVQFSDNASGIPCDVSIGNVGGVENSQILFEIKNVHPDLIGAYIHIVKEWGKAREVIAPEKQMFNSFTVTTMALMVLQELAILPVFFKTSGPCGELTLEDAKQALDGWQPPEVYRALKTDEQIGEAILFLLQKFAEYYSKFDFKEGTVSLICPRRRRTHYQETVAKYLALYGEIKRSKWEAHHKEHRKEVGDFSEEDFKDAMINEESQRPFASPYIVEDFVNFINCGRRVPVSRMGSFVTEIKRLDELVNRTDDTLVYADIFKSSNRIPKFAHFEGTGVIGKREMRF